MGKAVVSTTIGCEGLAAVNGGNSVIADNPDSFAEAVSRLLNDPGERARLGAEGRRTVVAQYDWGPLSVELARAWHGASEAAGAVRR